jgi:peroxiredoxin
MAAIEAGTMAPDFTWPATDGKSYSLQQALSQGPVLVAFFKVGCPTCQFTFPFLERFAQHFPERVWGVSQDDAASSKQFAQRYGITFPLLLEDLDDYPTSNAYGLSHVPSLFLIGRDGEILHNSVGFLKQDLEDIAAKLARLTGQSGFQLFQDGEDIPKYKAG